MQVSPVFIPKLNHTLTNCYLFVSLVFEPQCCFMAGTHQGISVESRAQQVYSEESDDQYHSWAIITCG